MVLPVRNNSYSCTLVSAAVVERLESHPSKNEECGLPAAGRHPEIPKAFVWVWWKFVASDRMRSRQTQRYTLLS
jgi:hypothetical protein